MIIDIQHLLGHRNDMRRLLTGTSRLVSCAQQPTATKALTRIGTHPGRLVFVTAKI